jgi:hypothetical protein
MKMITKKLYFTFGFTFFIIGLLGYYLPVLPGTIFMIISAYFFMHSSENFYNKIINNPYYGAPIKMYIENNVIPLKSKVIILLSIWIATFFTVNLDFLTTFNYKTNLAGMDFIINFKNITIILSLIGSYFVLKTKNR